MLVDDVVTSTVCKRMGVLLTNDDLAGESKYESALPGIVNKLAGDIRFTQENDGAKVVYLDGWKNREGEPLPLMSKKADGSYNCTQRFSCLLDKSKM